MKTLKKLRGSGFKHTLPAVFPSTAVWIVVVVLIPPIIIISMMAAGFLSPSLYPDIWFFLFTRMPLVALAAVVLAIFTTSRAVGPLVALRAACADVERGDLNRRVRFRRGDRHFRELETAFNEMMVAICERGDMKGGLGAEAPDPAEDTAN